MSDTFRRIVCVIYSSYPRLPDKYFQHSAYFLVADRGTKRDRRHSHMFYIFVYQHALIASCLYSQLNSFNDVLEQ